MTTSEQIDSLSVSSVRSSDITLHNAPRPPARPRYRPRNVRVEVDRHYHPRYIVPRPISVIRNQTTVIHREMNIFEPPYYPAPIFVPSPVIVQPPVIYEPTVITEPAIDPVVITEPYVEPVDDTYSDYSCGDDTYADEDYYEDEDYEQGYPYNLSGSVYGYDETGGLYIYSGEPEISIINTGQEYPLSDYEYDTTIDTGDYDWVGSFDFDYDSGYDIFGRPTFSKCIWCNWGIPYNCKHSLFCQNRFGWGGEDFIHFDWLFWSLGFEW